MIVEKYKKVTSSMSLTKSLNKKFKGKSFKFETHHGGIVNGVVDNIIIQHGLQLTTSYGSEYINDYVRYDIVVRSEKKNLYEFDRCWFK